MVIPNKEKAEGSVLTVGPFTPATIEDLRFSIPVYQRLFAWDNRQITDLLRDFKNSLNEDVYYLGTITVDYNKKSSINDIIDGQQRLTALVLLATILVQYDVRWKQFLWHLGSERLIFPSREEDMHYIKTAAEGTPFDSEDVNRKLPIARKIMMDFISNEKEFATDEARVVYAKFVFDKVCMVLVKLPEGTDMNWYFEVMNSRGEQLEKHEILKARVLDNVPKELRYAFSRIWNSCSQMDGYLEEFVDDETATKILAFNGSEDSLHRIINSFDRKNFEGELPHTLFEILMENKDHVSDKEKKQAFRINSIVNFSELLLLAYSTFKKIIPKDFSEKNLLKIVDFTEPENYAKFVGHLLKTRMLFDSFVIKNILIDNTIKWDISFTTRNETSGEEAFVRFKILGLLTHLQSMIHVSSAQIEYWLVPFLSYLDTHRSIIYMCTEEQVELFLRTWLEKFDHQMAFSRVTKGLTLRQVADENLANTDVGAIPFLIPESLLCKGTGTDRYWFYKMDYCLLKFWSVKGQPEKHMRNKRFIDKFQFRQSRSVEHVYPQHPLPPNKYWEIEILNSFGNLALISNSTNASFNNNTPETKRTQFEYHKEKWGLESLKLLEVYSQEWNKDISSRHQEEMISILNEFN
ncbi:MAG: DUF262 domain-containing HNH endonuclease family protein [Bacteroidetes bacterium]|nr:DUF262 domain-containing HNH endonuclease family protein [Bacteroidota bacterium]